jgi:hypothetical protein
MAKFKKTEEVDTSKPEPTATQSELAAALVQALEMAKPPAKKTVFTRTKNTPWTKPGEAKPKLRRKFFQHSIQMDPEKLSSKEIELLNKLRPGFYCNGYIKVYKRKDNGLDIDYPIKTASQKLTLGSKYGLRSLTEILEHCIEEANAPAKPIYDEDGNFTD